MSPTTLDAIFTGEKKSEETIRANSIQAMRRPSSFLSLCSYILLHLILEVVSGYDRGGLHHSLLVLGFARLRTRDKGGEIRALVRQLRPRVGTLAILLHLEEKNERK